MSQPPPAFSEDRLRPWLTETLLPFWASQGFDSASGAFVEKFDGCEMPSVENYTRLRVQARQIYVFSHAAVAGFSEVGLARARSTYAFLDAQAWDADAGGWHHRLSRQGQVLDHTKDSYDHAFMLLALAWLYRAGGDEAVLQRAEATVSFMDEALGLSREGSFDGYRERQVAAGAENPLPRRQNPHMHLLEGLLALYEASGEARWLARADQVVGLFQRHFFDSATGQLIEFFDHDWREVRQDGRRLREPGHFFEWTWLLHRYAGHSGDQSALAAQRQLFDWAWRHGVDGEGGASDVVFEELDPEARILAGGRKRLWPQTEAVKACLAAYERTGEAEALEGARRMLAALFRTFASLERPTWREQVDREGQLIREETPASSLYHLFLAVAEAIRVLPGAQKS